MKKSFLISFIISFIILFLISISLSQNKTCYTESCVDPDYTLMLATFDLIKKQGSYSLNPNISYHINSSGSFGFPFSYLNIYAKGGDLIGSKDYSISGLLLNIAIIGLIGFIISWGISARHKKTIKKVNSTLPTYEI